MLNDGYAYLNFWCGLTNKAFLRVRFVLQFFLGGQIYEPIRMNFEKNLLSPKFPHHHHRHYNHHPIISSNGTFVNNVRLSRAGQESGLTEVFTGDILR